MVKHLMRTTKGLEPKLRIMIRHNAVNNSHARRRIIHLYKQHKKDDDRHLVIHFVQTAQKKTM